MCTTQKYCLLLYNSAHTHCHMVFPCACFAGLLTISLLCIWLCVAQLHCLQGGVGEPSGLLHSVPCLVLLSAWSQPSGDPAVWVALAYTCILVQIQFLVFFRLPDIPLAEFRHHLEEQLMCLIAFSKMIMARRLQLGNSFIFPLDCREGRCPFVPRKAHLGSSGSIL